MIEPILAAGPLKLRFPRDREENDGRIKAGISRRQRDRTRSLRTGRRSAARTQAGCSHSPYLNHLPSR